MIEKWFPLNAINNDAENMVIYTLYNFLTIHLHCDSPLKLMPSIEDKQVKDYIDKAICLIAGGFNPPVFRALLDYELALSIKSSVLLERDSSYLLMFLAKELVSLLHREGGSDELTNTCTQLSNTKRGTVALLLEAIQFYNVP